MAPAYAGQPCGTAWAGSVLRPGAGRGGPGKRGRGNRRKASRDREGRQAGRQAPGWGSPTGLPGQPFLRARNGAGLSCWGSRRGRETAAAAATFLLPSPDQRPPGRLSSAKQPPSSPDLDPSTSSAPSWIWIVPKAAPKGGGGPLDYPSPPPPLRPPSLPPSLDHSPTCLSQASREGVFVAAHLFAPTGGNLMDAPAAARRQTMPAAAAGKREDNLGGVSAGEGGRTGGGPPSHIPGQTPTVGNVPLKRGRGGEFIMGKPITPRMTFWQASEIES